MASTIAAVITSIIAVVGGGVATLTQLLDDHHPEESGNLVPIKRLVRARSDELGSELINAVGRPGFYANLIRLGDRHGAEEPVLAER
jgi:hypothetical protein